MARRAWMCWMAATVAAVLLELPFPLAGPMPAWRGVFAWFGLAPLLWAVLSERTLEEPKPMRQAFLLSYWCGFLWYCGNCYWVRDTMARYGDMPAVAPTLLLIAFSLVLGLYFGLFGLALMLVRRATGSTRWALCAAPFLWTAMELAASRITSVPWDQLGYSQVDNPLLSGLAPWTGVYGISFALVLFNSILVGLLYRKSRILSATLVTLCLIVFWVPGLLSIPVKPVPPAQLAVLVQPNLDVGSEDAWAGDAWAQHMAEFTKLAGNPCTNYIAGIPQTDAATVKMNCAQGTKPPDLVAWPESPAPYFEGDPRLRTSMSELAQAVHAPLVIGSIGADLDPSGQAERDYNSALVIGADGEKVGRYDKIHLVPFGEYVPFRDLLFFARKLTGRVSAFDRGEDRKVFRLNGHRYGVFICYEAVFADEVRQFARLGAEVLVNISDDGWYGDTSAPWQHLNMARMRAIENRRWILRDTNNGVTAVIDPYGRVRQSIPRHEVGALAAHYGFNQATTFYTEHGDVFAWLCVILTVVLLLWCMRARLRLRVQIQARS